MVLVDEEGTRLHATLEEELISKHAKDLKEGEYVSVNAFLLKDYSDMLKTSRISHKLTFFRSTKIKPVDAFLVTNLDQYFVDFNEILYNSSLDASILIDVIRQIIIVGSIEDVLPRGKSTSTPKLELTLRDVFDVRLQCTLWGDYAHHVHSYAETHKTGVVVCVMKLVQIKKYKGRVSISNAFNTTRIVFDPETDHVVKFKSMLPSDIQAFTRNDQTRQISWGSQMVNMHDEFFGRNRRNTVSGILEPNVVGKFVMTATVRAIENPGKWCYYSCKLCNTKVQPYGDDSDDEENHKTVYSCKTHGDIEEVFTRYYLILRVSDDLEGETKFLFFNESGEKLLNKSAEALTEEIDLEIGITIPPTLTAVIGKKYLFKIQVPVDDKKNNTKAYVVELVWDDIEEIERFESQANDSQETPLLLTSVGEGSNTTSTDSLTPLSVTKGKNTKTVDPEDRRSVTKKLKVEKN